MTDYPQSFPDAVLMIRDLGYPGTPNVEFWFYAGDQTINFAFVQFEKRVNGVVTVFTVGVPSYAGWMRVSTDNAILDQYVTFNLDTNLGIAKSGHADPGYPYSFTTHISRPAPPDAPSRPYLVGISVNSVVVGWDPPDNNGGATITGYQVGYGTNSSSPTTIVPFSSGEQLKNLAMGTYYYVWVRAGNYQGWGPWSSFALFRTFLGAYVKSGGVWKVAVPYVNVGGIWREAEPIVHHS